MTTAPATVDRTYWHVPGARSWHALALYDADGVNGEHADGSPRYALIAVGMCGRRADLRKSAVYPGLDTEQADRVPSNGHLCGSCARVIAARTDVEG